MRETADRHPEAERVELWFMDEARVGQKGRLTHVWYQKGVRPRGLRQQGFASAHLFGAVCPGRGEGVALVLPEVSTAAMGVFLAELARAVPAGTHAALVLDGAGWHVSEDLAVPANLTLIHPPPYSPELNPVERVWEHLRDRSGCLTGRINFARSAIAALAKHAGAELDAPRPVLRVDHEQAGRTHQHVVDVGLRATGPPAVVDP